LDGRNVCLYNKQVSVINTIVLEVFVAVVLLVQRCGHLVLLLTISMFNYIVVPYLSEALVLPNCFLNLVPTVTITVC
jgi:hypothetical protein